ncbi:alpha-methylacyl-CoA racemase [Musca vetustissima]|uniref:alpha-methylacyl-CoA racemase n=1 Tax=Musca vetustissima TaxID=27455 RepID=UPI002AB64FE0|nr:alpha-methylacyl-CoA racemase [Musca vetustissima]
MPLKGIKVLEFAGLAPAPFCGKILADFGAKVTVIDRVPDNLFNCMSRGKRVLAINLKAPEGQKLARKLAGTQDVLIEPFRPGVMEKLNLGPEILCKENPKLIYARLTGFGQTGRLAARAGHDINYAAISGVLSMLGHKNQNPQPPMNILADFAGGGLMCALGICMALLERYRSGRGQVVDSAMVDGAAYVASWLFMARSIPSIFQGERGTNALDGGFYFYDVYKTKDGKYMSVGALEQQFFNEFVNKLGLPELSQGMITEEEQKTAKAMVTKKFLEKTQAEWSAIFEDIDACVYPIVDWENVMEHDHNKTRQAFEKLDDGCLAPTPAPRLSRTPGKLSTRPCTSAEAVEESLDILKDLKLSNKELQKLVSDKVLILPAQAKL